MGPGGLSILFSTPGSMTMRGGGPEGGGLCLRSPPRGRQKRHQCALSCCTSVISPHKTVFVEVVIFFFNLLI